MRIHIRISGLNEHEFVSYAEAIEYLEKVRRGHVTEQGRPLSSQPFAYDPPTPSPGYSGGGGSFGGGGASGGWDPPSKPDFGDVQSGGSSTGGSK